MRIKIRPRKARSRHVGDIVDAIDELRRDVNRLLPGETTIEVAGRKFTESTSPAQDRYEIGREVNRQGDRGKDDLGDMGGLRATRCRRSGHGEKATPSLASC